MSTATITTDFVDDTNDSLFTVTLASAASGYYSSILTTVTSSSADVSAWVSEVLASSPAPFVVGLDVEWRPIFNPHDHHPVALLQLCASPSHCLLFQLLYADSIPSDLIAFLQNPSLKFVGVGIGDDVEKLIEDHDISVKNTVDLRGLAAERLGRKEAKQMGIGRLAMEVIGFEVSKQKKVRLSRWDQETLRMDQIGYAAVDAFLSFEIGRRLFDTAPPPPPPCDRQSNSNTG